MSNLRNRAIQDLRQKAANLRIEAQRLENQRGLGAREAVEAVNKAKQLRNQADQLERNKHYTEMYLNEREAELQLQDGHASDKARDAFSAIQNELLGAENAFNEAVDVAVRNLSYNAAINVSEATINRNIGRLLRGEGMVDSEGRRYVDFTEGRNNPTYRAIQTPTGEMDIVTASMNGGGE